MDVKTQSDKISLADDRDNIFFAVLTGIRPCNHDNLSATNSLILSLCSLHACVKIKYIIKSMNNY